MATRRQLEERQAQAALDLAEVEEQLAAGELDHVTAARLQARYERELETAADRLREGPEEEAPSARSLKRVLVGAVVMSAAVIGVVFLVANAVEDREEGEFATGSIESPDLADVSTEEMEELVAENPNVVGMRLALARRYFEAGDFSAAFPHYFAILGQQPDNPEANANLGWMTYLSAPAESETAAAFLERSLAALPEYEPAKFFLANVRLYGLDDSAGALLLLEELAADGDLPADVAARVDEMILEARS